ncbi:unnamed protein product [Lota lota]
MQKRLTFALCLLIVPHSPTQTLVVLGRPLQPRGSMTSLPRLQGGGRRSECGEENSNCMGVTEKREVSGCGEDHLSLPALLGALTLAPCQQQSQSNC